MRSSSGDPKSIESPAQGSPAGSQLDLLPFNPHSHSWILVDACDSMNLPSELPTTPAKNDAHISALEPESYGGVVSPLDSGLDSKEAGVADDEITGELLHDSILDEGEGLAALSISELILGSGQPSSLSMSAECVGQLCASCSYADLIGVTLANAVAGSTFNKTEEDTGKGETLKFGTPACDTAVESHKLCRYESGGWSRPLALVAILLASHAAAFFLGLAIGRRTEGAAVPFVDSILVRRYSSGPAGMYSRLCMG